MRWFSSWIRKRAGASALTLVVLFFTGSAKLYAEQSSAKIKEHATAHSPARSLHQWFIWLEQAQQARAMLQVDARASNRWLWRLPKEMSHGLELCVFPQRSYELRTLESVGLAWPSAENYKMGTKQAILCARPDQTGVIELKVKPFLPQAAAEEAAPLVAPSAKTKRARKRRVKPSTTARLMTRLTPEALEALMKTLPTVKVERPTPSSSDQWWLIEAPNAKELQGALFVVDVTFKQERFALPVELGAIKGGGERSFIIVSEAAFELEDHVRLSKRTSAPTAWSHSEQLKPHDKVWMFGALKKSITLWSERQESDYMLSFKRQPEPVQALKKVRLDEEALFIGARAPELYSSGSSTGLKPEPQEAKDQAQPKASCESAAMGSPLTVSWTLLWLMMTASRARRRRPRLTPRRLGIAVALIGALVVPAVAMAKDKASVCQTRARVYWDGRDHQQQLHWRALCAPDEAALPDDYHVVIALPPAKLDLSAPVKQEKDAKSATPQALTLRGIEGLTNSAWELALEQRIGKAQTTREYVMVGYKLYQSAYHVDACVHAKNKHMARLASEFDELAPLCKRGWMVLVAYLRLKPKAATQTRQRATRGDRAVYEGVIAYLPAIKVDWRGAQSISAEPGFTPAQEGAAYQEIHAPWPIKVSSLGPCYINHRTSLTPQLTIDEAPGQKKAKPPRVKSRFMFEHSSELKVEEYCTREKLTLKLEAP